MSYSNIIRAIGANSFTQFNSSANLLDFSDDGAVYFAGTSGPSTVQGATAFNFGTLGYTGTRYVTMELIPLPGQSQLSMGFIMNEDDQMVPALPTIYYRVMGGSTTTYVGQPFGASNTQTFRFGISFLGSFAGAGAGYIVLRFDDLGQEIQRIPYSWSSI